MRDLSRNPHEQRDRRAYQKNNEREQEHRQQQQNRIVEESRDRSARGMNRHESRPSEALMRADL